MRLAKTILMSSMLLLSAAVSVAVDVELKLEPTDLTVRPGRLLPVRVVAVNRGSEMITLILPGDGSIAGWRSPVIGWSVIDASEREKEHPEIPALDGYLCCPSLTPLRREEIVSLAPGEEVQLRALDQPTIYETGKYRVSFHYRNVPEMKWMVPALQGEDLKRAVTKTTPVSVWSNEIVVSVE